MPKQATVAQEPLPIVEWMILGSFPMHQREPGHWQDNGYEAERDFAPAPGEAFRGSTWTPWKGLAGSGSVDLMHPGLRFGHHVWCYTYAACYVRSAKDQAVRFLVGSDDGFTLYLNGRERGRVDMQRALVPDESAVPVRLRKGWNLVVVKIGQGVGAWGFQVRVSGPRGVAPEHPVVFQLDRPQRSGFSGLRDRRAGVRVEAAEARPILHKGAFGVAAGVRVFNDSASAARKVSVQLRAADGVAVARGMLARINPFAVETCELWIPLSDLGRAIGHGAGAPEAVVSSNGSSDTLRVHLGSAFDAFVHLLGGLEIPVAGTGRQKLSVPIPDVVRGRPALVRVEPREPARLSREVSHPELPEVSLAASKTRTASAHVEVEIPLGARDVVGRVWFGTPCQRETVERLRFLARDVAPDANVDGELAREGLAALAGGDFDAAVKLAGRLEQEVDRRLGSLRHQKVTLVGHAHLDMNWLWVEPETVQCAQDTFRQVLRFMEEFPEFRFSQSQASVYEMVERTDPELFAEVVKRVKEGRWEVLGGAVDEGDTNLSSGEAIARTMLLGQTYFRSRFGRRASVGWLPDNFGHVAQLPQILSLAGVRYFFGHRCQPTSGPYWWEAPNGSQLLAFATPTYNGEVTPAIRHAPEQYNPKQGTSMAVYGVGDHGGGPSRRDITRALEYGSFRAFPKIEFGTAEAFYRGLEKGGAAYPTHRGERQYIFEGCYTTIARVKKANRDGENLLYVAELIAALRSVEAGETYPAELFGKAWWTQTFNQFHDILCGSAIHEANREALAMYHAAQAPVEEWVGVALRRFWKDWGRKRAPRPVTAQGHPVLVFNPIPSRRTDVAETEIFTPISPPTARVPHWGHFLPQPVRVDDVGQGPFASVRVEDDAGREIPGQVVDGKLFPNGYRARVQFLAEDVPPTGLRGYRVFPGDPGVREPRLRTGEHWIETPRYRIEFDPTTGHIRNLRDTKAKRDVLSKGQHGHALNASMEAPHSMSGWDLGPVTRVDRIDDVQTSGVVEHGPVRAVYEVRRKWGRSEFVQRTIAYADLDRIDFELRMLWYEVGGADRDSPTLRVTFPMAVAEGRFSCDTPYAVVERPRTGREVPAQKWVDLSGGGYGVALLSDSKYGFRCTENVVEMTLVRAAYEPDICPDLGPHTVRYALLPHRGSWKTGKVDRAGAEFSLPIAGSEAPTGCDIGAPKPGLSLSPDNLFLSAWKRAENGRGWIVRFHEGRGRACRAELTFPRRVKSAQRVDLLEESLGDAPAPRASGRKVRVEVGAHEIVSLRVALG